MPADQKQVDISRERALVENNVVAFRNLLATMRSMLEQEITAQLVSDLVEKTNELEVLMIQVLRAGGKDNPGADDLLNMRNALDAVFFNEQSPNNLGRFNFHDQNVSRAWRSFVRKLYDYQPPANKEAKSFEGAAISKRLDGFLAMATNETELRELYEAQQGLTELRVRQKQLVDASPYNVTPEQRQVMQQINDLEAANEAPPTAAYQAIADDLAHELNFRIATPLIPDEKINELIEGEHGVDFSGLAVQLESGRPSSVVRNRVVASLRDPDPEPAAAYCMALLAEQAGDAKSALEGYRDAEVREEFPQTARRIGRLVEAQINTYSTGQRGNIHKEDLADLVRGGDTAADFTRRLGRAINLIGARYLEKSYFKKRGNKTEAEGLRDFKYEGKDYGELITHLETVRTSIIQKHKDVFNWSGEGRLTRAIDAVLNAAREVAPKLKHASPRTSFSAAENSVGMFAHAHDHAGQGQAQQQASNDSAAPAADADEHAAPHVH